MKGLIYVDDAEKRKIKSLDLTPYLKGTVTNLSHFKIEGTNIYVKLCGQFDNKTRAYLFQNHKVAIIVNGYFNIFCIDLDKGAIKHHLMSWIDVHAHESFVIVTGKGELILFGVERYCKLIYDQKFVVEKTSLDGDVLTLSNNRHESVKFDLNTAARSHECDDNWGGQRT